MIKSVNFQELLASHTSAVPSRYNAPSVLVLAKKGGTLYNPSYLPKAVLMKDYAPSQGHEAGITFDLFNYRDKE